MARAVFYMHEDIGACAGLCSSDRTHQMEKTGTPSSEFLEGPTAPSPPLIREGGGSNYDKLMQAVAVFILATLILLS